jgi:hypothetical protein
MVNDHDAVGRQVDVEFESVGARGHPEVNAAIVFSGPSAHLPDARTPGARRAEERFRGIH